MRMLITPLCTHNPVSRVIGTFQGQQLLISRKRISTTSTRLCPPFRPTSASQLASATSTVFTQVQFFANPTQIFADCPFQKPGNVKLRPELLQKHQAYVKEKEGLKEDKPVFLVFHGGSGSSVEDFKEAISYGVVKVNLDTDMQFAYLSGVRDYVLNKKDYLMTQGKKAAKLYNLDYH
jgi:hypothetical protein